MKMFKNKITIKEIKEIEANVYENLAEEKRQEIKNIKG